MSARKALKTQTADRSAAAQKGAETKRQKREAAAAAAEPGSLRIPIASLVGILTNVALYASPDTHRHLSLCGSEWSINDGVLTVVATDSYTLIVETIAADDHTTMSGSGTMLISGGERATMLAACKTIPRSTWNGPKGGPPRIFAEIQFGTVGTPYVREILATDDAPAVPEVPAVPGLPGTAKIGRSTITIAVDLATEKFPDWKTLLPDPPLEASTSYERVAYSPPFLARIAKVCQPGRDTPSVDTSRDGVVKVVTQGALELTVATMDGIVILIMPVRLA